MPPPATPSPCTSAAISRCSVPARRQRRPPAFEGVPPRWAARSPPRQLPGCGSTPLIAVHACHRRTVGAKRQRSCLTVHQQDYVNRHDGISPPADNIAMPAPSVTSDLPRSSALLLPSVSPPQSIKSTKRCTVTVTVMARLRLRLRRTRGSLAAIRRRARAGPSGVGWASAHLQRHRRTRRAA